MKIHNWGDHNSQMEDWNVREKRFHNEISKFGKFSGIAAIIGVSRRVSPAKVSKCREDPTSRNAILTTVINLPARKLAPIKLQLARKNHESNIYLAQSTQTQKIIYRCRDCGRERFAVRIRIGVFRHQISCLLRQIVVKTQIIFFCFVLKIN